MKDFSRRLASLVKKEFNQLWRDNSSLLIGIVLPIILIFIMGYGLNFDVKNVPTAIVLEDTSPLAQDMLSFANGSIYFEPYYVTSMQEAVQLFDARKVDAIIRVPSDFTESLYAGRAQVQAILYGIDATNATTIRGYIEGSIGQWQANRLPTLLGTYGSSASVGSVAVSARVWFNDANTSTWYIIPGLIVMVLTLVGVFLTALLMAREWERGTLEALFVTPVRPLEILLAKIIPYFCISMLGFFLCLLAARYCFEVPLHGSLAMLIFCSMLYIITALSLGLLISSVTKNQFVACQMALVTSLMPTMMLSGFLFDLRSVPSWVSAIGHVLPPTYYMEIVKILFLAGDNWAVVGKNTFILGCYAVLSVCIALHVTRKSLE